MLKVKYLCIAYLGSYIQCKVTEFLLHDKVLSSDFDQVKEMAVKGMEQYISQQEISEADKVEIKQNHKPWADMVFRALSNNSMNEEK